MTVPGIQHGTAAIGTQDIGANEPSTYKESREYRENVQPKSVVQPFSLAIPGDPCHNNAIVLRSDTGLMCDAVRRGFWDRG